MADPKTEVIVKLIGEDGNVFAIIGRVAGNLKRAGYRDEAKEFQTTALKCSSYNEVLALVQNYVIVE